MSRDQSSRGGARVVWRRIRKAPPLVVVSAALLLVLIGIAVFAPLLMPYGHTEQNLRLRLQPPVFLGGPAEHILGTDHIGRDTLSRLLLALRTSLTIATIGTAIGFTVGVALGLISGLARSWLDNLIMFLVDTQLALPFTLVALTVIAIFGTSLVVLVPVIGLAGWSQYARLTRGQVLSTREQPFVEAVRALGGSQWRVAVRHILPNITSPLIVLATYTFSQIMLLESALSFLGLGVQPPDASLGSMVGNGRNYLISAWWIAIVPATVLVMITMAISLLGDWLRDTFDPQLDN